MAFHRYIIDYPPETYQYTPFTLPSGVCTDPYSFWYCRVSTPLIPLSPLIGEAIFFNDWFLTFKAETSDPSHAGFYTISVTGTLPNHQATTSGTFQIQLFNIPPATYIMPT
jgi:hypothetical protein